MINFANLQREFVPFDVWQLSKSIGELGMPTGETPSVEAAFDHGFTGRRSGSAGGRTKAQQVTRMRPLGDKLDQVEEYLDGADAAWRESACGSSCRTDDCMRSAFDAVSTMTDVLIDFFKALAPGEKALDLALNIPSDRYQATRSWGDMEQRIQALQELGVLRTALAAQTIRKFGSNPQKHEHQKVNMESAELAISVAETYCQTLKHALFSFPALVRLRHPTHEQWTEEMQVSWDVEGRVAYSYTINNARIIQTLREIGGLGDKAAHLHPHVERLVQGIAPVAAIEASRRASPPHLEGEVPFTDRDTYRRWLRVLFSWAARPWHYQS